MRRLDVVQLVSEDPTAHGVFDSPTETTRTVFCEVKSVSRNEVYQALAVGINASIVFALTVAEDYEGEKELIWNSVRYRIIRTYIVNDGIELTCEVAEHGDIADSTTSD